LKKQLDSTNKSFLTLQDEHKKHQEESSNTLFTQPLRCPRCARCDQCQGKGSMAADEDRQYKALLNKLVCDEVGPGF